MKRIVAACILALVAVVALIVVRGSGLESRQIQVEPVVRMDVDADAAAKRLSRAITYRTISHFDRSNLDAAAFQGAGGQAPLVAPLHVQRGQRLHALSHLGKGQGRHEAGPGLLLPGVEGLADRTVEIGIHGPRVV